MKNIYTIVAGMLFASIQFGAISQTVVVDEKFDNGIPSNYILYNEDGYTPHADVSEYTNAWIAKVDPEDSTNMTASSTSYFDSPGIANRWMVVPGVELGAYGNTLSWVGKSQDASFSEDYLVLISTTGTDIESFTDTIEVVLHEDVYWTQHAIDLSELGYNDQTVNIAFVLRSIDGFKFYMDSLKVVAEDPVGVKNETFVQINVYPNPTSDFIHVDFEGVIDEVRVLDLKGTELTFGSSTKLDVSNLVSGVYFVEVRSLGNRIVRKIVKN